MYLKWHPHRISLAQAGVDAHHCLNSGEEKGNKGSFLNVMGLVIKIKDSKITEGSLQDIS